MSWKALCHLLLSLLQGPYVLVMVATGQHQKSNKLPAMWLISAYRNLSRPFRKNVRYILLVRPTGGLKALVACIRPFVSSKAAKKVKKVTPFLWMDKRQTLFYTSDITAFSSDKAAKEVRKLFFLVDSGKLVSVLCLLDGP